MCWLVVLQFSEQTHTVCSENWEEMTACTVFFSSIFAKWWHATGLACGLLEMHATVFILSQAFSSLTGISGWATAFLLASRGAEWMLEPVLQFQDAVCWEALPPNCEVSHHTSQTRVKAQLLELGGWRCYQIYGAWISRSYNIAYWWSNENPSDILPGK